MGTIVEFRKNLQPLLNRRRVYKMLFDTMRSLEAYLVDFNKIQLEQGKDIHGKIVGTYKRATEIESIFGKIKPILPKSQGSPFNFQWTGALFKGMKMTIKGGNVAIFDSTDPKAAMLTAQYGELFGLSDEHLTEAINDKILPLFLQKIKNQLKI